MAKLVPGRIPPVVTAVAVLLMMGALVALAAARRPAAGSDDTKTAEAPATKQQQHRYAPTLALVMAAYKGVQDKDDKTNPEAVAALKKAFERNASAKKTMSRHPSPARSPGPGSPPRRFSARARFDGSFTSHARPTRASPRITQ